MTQFKKHGTLFTLVLVILMLSLVVSGCGNTTTTPSPEAKKTSGPVTITFWHTQNTDETKTLDSIVSDFQAKNPDIKVEVTAVPFDDAQKKYTIAAQNGDAPDVFRSEIAWTPQFASLGFLAPLDNLVSKEDLADYMTAPLNYNKYQGKLWGVPQVTDALGLLYNKKMFQAAGISGAPKTMDEFVADAQKLTDAAKGQYGFFMRGDSYWLQPFVWAYGGGLLDEQKNIFINNAGSVKGLQFVLDLRDKYKVMPKVIDFKNDYDNMQTGFKTGKYAMIFNGPWATSDILGGAEFKDAANLGVAPIPTGPDGKTGSPVGGHNYVIYKDSKHIDAAYKFINFINSAENQAKFAKNNNLLPTRKSAYDLPDIKSNPLLLGFKAVLDKATNRPVIPEGGQIYTDFTPNYQAALTGQATPQQALDKVAEAWKKLLNK